ncbi:MAG: efflux RND transporter permease subunit [Endomicrobia bacterium]|nr:efflux RND transporter permease subunit [Endomicrobiia bacterium]MCL2506168.1 efflux RND transporter permease subunit [Endomicrobiia bacterium]
MLDFFVKRPVTTVMFVLLWVALGIASFPRMNIELAPPIDFPMVTVTFVYPGASPVDMESLIVKRAEDAISEISGLKNTVSQIFENGAFVMAEFDFGVNVNDKTSEVKGKIDSLAGEFPDDMRSPVVARLNPLQEPVMDIALSGADPREIDLFIKDALSQQITSLSGVASVSVFGAHERAVRIELLPELMAARGATIADVVRTLSMSNLNVPGGRIENSRNSKIVRFVGEFKSINAISNLRMSTPEGGNFALSEIATITDAIRDVESGASFNGDDVVIVSVVRASDGNAVRISNAVRRNFPKFESMMEDYFRDSGAQPSMRIISDTSTTISRETNNTLNSILLGILLTVITLFAFTRNWRTTIIGAVVIPVSLVSGFFFMDMSGFSINVMTLLAMATSLGTLITSAIILIESALGQLDAGASPEDAAIKGTKKAAVPVMAAAGTNLVVFLPLAFMGGIAGQFMKFFGMTVVYLTILSLMFSFTLTPMMIAKILRKTSDNSKKQKKNEKPLAWFAGFFNFQIKYPLTVITVSFAILISSGFLMRWIGNEFQSSSDMNEINITARGPVGTTYAKSEQIAREIEKRVREFKEVEFTSAKIGERGTQNISIKLGLTPRENRKLSDRRLTQLILPKLADIPGVEIQIFAGQNTSNNMVLNITGFDDARRDAYAKDILNRLNEIEEIQSAVLAAQRPGNELKFIPDIEKMQYWGISNQAAAVALRTALFGNDSLKYREDGNEFPIIIEFDNEYKTRSMFETIFVSSPKGLVALSKLGKIETVIATSDITRRNKARVTEIGINIGKSTMGPVQSKIEEELRNIDFAPGYEAVFGGLSEMQDEATAEIVSAFLLATVLIYMLLAAMMNSLAHPFTVATSILFAFAGVFLTLFLTGANINMAAMLAVVMLVGLAVTNNILVLEPTIVRISKGEQAAKALWEEFVDKRRMLFMTTIAIVAGMAPQLWSPEGTRMSMGAVIIGGMLASLFWTFAVTPALFIVIERLSGRRKTKTA